CFARHRRAAGALHVLCRRRRAQDAGSARFMSVTTGSHSALRDSMARLFYEPAGPLTADLVRQPGGFGLGQLPITQIPDATTTMVCGFCSTGCGLNIHLQDGKAIGLTPTAQYPVNLGMACPKGWEALTVLQASDRATAPLIKDARGRHRPV